MKHMRLAAPLRSLTLFTLLMATGCGSGPKGSDLIAQIGGSVYLNKGGDSEGDMLQEQAAILGRSAGMAIAVSHSPTNDGNYSLYAIDKKGVVHQVDGVVGTITARIAHDAPKLVWEQWDGSQNHYYRCDMASGALTEIDPPGDLSAVSRPVAISGDGEREVWQTNRGTWAIVEGDAILHEVKEGNTDVGLAFTPDGSGIWASQYNGEITVIDVDSGQLGEPLGLGLSPTGIARVGDSMVVHENGASWYAIDPDGGNKTLIIDGFTPIGGYDGIAEDMSYAVFGAKYDSYDEWWYGWVPLPEGDRNEAERFADNVAWSMSWAVVVQ